MFAKIIVDIAHSNVDKIFEYSCDDTLYAGSRVKVPFGGRIIDGFVIGTAEKSEYPPEKIKPVYYVYDEKPALVYECLTLMEKIARRFATPKVSVLRLFIPSEMRLGKVKEAFTKIAHLNEGEYNLKASAKKQAEGIEILSKGDTEYSLLVQRVGQSAVTALINKGAITIRREENFRTPLKNLTPCGGLNDLTEAQRSAVNEILSDTRTVQLLHGVTGSGKTEVYLNVIARAIRSGKTAIFLVPEISLTPQTLLRLRSRFGESAAIMHSGLSAGERFDEWRRLRQGEAKIAIGARSAIFAPLENIGVIIIDEEHDTSYVAETSPRYSAIDIAKLRAEYNGAKLILGSATPSIESYEQAIKGAYNLIELPERINKKPMPEFIVADMRREVRQGNNSIFSRALKEEIDKVLKGGKQAMIYLNRRGYSKMLVCRDCGYVAKCENCDVSLTYHSAENRLKCHYCGSAYKMPSACPECGGVHIVYSGTGTQKVVAELNALFKDAKILRMDNDTVSGKDGHYKILSEFAAHKADILVGTQMIAKGHDFPDVTLVGILDADMSLHFSDYRSGERTFQLITQVAGRCGRADEKGKTVLQTYSPENYILRYAIGYDYKGFFQNEISVRKATLFPPFSYIVRVMVTSVDNDCALNSLKKVYFALDELRCGSDEFIFLNRSHSPVKKIQGKVRYQCLMRLKSKMLLDKIYSIANEASNQTTLCYVEENPINLN